MAHAQILKAVVFITVAASLNSRSQKVVGLEGSLATSPTPTSPEPDLSTPSPNHF